MCLQNYGTEMLRYVSASCFQFGSNMQFRVSDFNNKKCFTSTECAGLKDALTLNTWETCKWHETGFLRRAITCLFTLNKTEHFKMAMNQGQNNSLLNIYSHSSLS